MKINIYLANQVESKPWIKTSIPALPRMGDEFEMERGKTYRVERVWFKPGKAGACTVNVSLVDPNEPLLERA